MKPLDPRLLTHAAAARTLIIGAGVAGGISAVATVGIAVALADLITAVAIDHDDSAAYSLPLLVIAVLVKAAAVWAGESLPRRTATVMVNQLRRALLDRLVAQDRSWTVRQQPSQLIQLATSGVGELQNYAARYLPQLILASFVPLGIVVFLAFTDGWSALIIAVTLPLVPLFMALVGLHTRDHAAGQLHALQVLGGHFLDLIGGLPTLKVFSRSRTQEAGIRKAGDQYRETTLRTLRVAFLSSMVLELIATISVALVAVSIGLRLVHDTLDLRTGLTVLLIAPEAFAALRAVGTHFHASADGLAAADQVFAVLAEPLPVRGDAPVPAFTELRVAAELHGVSLELTVPALQVTLLTGPSGSGKSTALSLLSGLAQPTSGAVYLADPPIPWVSDGDARVPWVSDDQKTLRGSDGPKTHGSALYGALSPSQPPEQGSQPERRTSAATVAAIDPDSWSAQVAYLVQSPHLQAGSVLDNVRALRPAASEAAARRALWNAAADELVAALPAGIHTVLSEGAAELSHGQRARIALARTLLADRPVLLLDEPTAALDIVTEQTLIARLRPALRGRTVVIASHREALAELADHTVDVQQHLAPVAV